MFARPSSIRTFWHLPAGELLDNGQPGVEHPRNTFGSHGKRRGFTMTELLVVISAIVLLIAILVAGLSRAREYARIASCLSNLHQLSLAALNFRQANQGGFPNDYQSPTGYWYQEIKPYDTNMAGNAICPDASLPADPSATTLGVGSADTAWGLVNPSGAYGWLHGTVCSYGLNVHAGGYSAVPVVASYGQATFGGNTTYYGSVASATSIGANGHARITGSVQSGGSITLNGNISVGGSDNPNMPGMQPPNVTDIYNQIIQNDNPAPFAGGNTIDFTNSPYLLVNGNFNGSGQMQIIGSGTLVVSGSVTFNGQFPSQGTANMNIVTLGSVTIHGQLSLDGSIYAAGNFISGGGHSIRGDIVVGGYYDDHGKGFIAEAPPPPFDPRANGTQILQDQPLFGDCIWVDASPEDTDAVPANLQLGDQDLNANDQMGRFCIDRHLGAVNISFTDGSARTVPLQNLWQLNWSGVFSPRNVTLP